MLRRIQPVLFVILILAPVSFAQSVRHFSFHYAFTVKNLSPGESVRIWMPIAQSDAYQDIKVISAKGDLPLKKTHESEFGDEMYYADASRNKQSELHFEIVYDVVRHEHLTLGTYSPHLESVALNPKEKKRDLAPDALVPTTGLPAELAAKSPKERHRLSINLAPFMITFFPRCATTKPEPAGAAVMCSTRAMQRKATAQTSIHCLLPWRVPRAFPRASKSGSRFPPTKIRLKSLAIIAGPSSSIRSTAGFPSISPKHGNIRRKRIISLERTMTIACSSRLAGTWN